MSDKTSAGLEISHAPFAKPPLHIPNAAGLPYKTELVEMRDPDGQTIKWNFWHAPDDDRAPHNHPWDFVSQIIHGGYTERRFVVIHKEGSDEVELRVSEHTYKVGDVNRLTRDVFHLVTAVVPGTVTRMVCEKAAPGNEWGYLDPKTGSYSKAAPDPSFIDRLKANNRFMK